MARKKLLRTARHREKIEYQKTIKLRVMEK